MSNLILQLEEKNFESEIKSGVVLVDFFAVWCGPCKMLTPILENAAAELKGKAKIVKVDVDNEQNLAMKFQVSSVPTLVLFKNGKEINRIIGLRDAEYIISMIQKEI